MPVKEGWPCKHAAGDSEVTAEFYVESKGKTAASAAALARHNQLSKILTPNFDLGNIKSYF